MKEVKIDQTISAVLQLLCATSDLLDELEKETGGYQEEQKNICHHIIQLRNLGKKIVSKNQQISQFEMIEMI